MNFDIIFFAICAIVIFYQLINTLGKKDSTEEKIRKKFEKIATELSKASKEHIAMAEDKINTTQETFPIIESDISDHPDLSEEERAINSVLRKVREKNLSFSKQKFLSGANLAFESLIEAFNNNDKETLRALLCKQLFEKYSKAIDKARKENKKNEVTLVSLDKSQVISAVINDSGVAKIGVEFQSTQIHLLRDVNNNIIQGNNKEIIDIEDSWVFEKNTNVKDPNWLIVAV